MKTEANGDILLACWDNGIVRYSPKGKLLSQMKIAGYRTINMAFGGSGACTLYVAANPTSGMVGMLIAVPWPRAGIALP
jgi:sugar lactone lactonase YvrE